MPVDIVNTYLEIQQLRKEVRKAELDLRISFAHPPKRSFSARPMEARFADDQFTDASFKSESD